MSEIKFQCFSCKITGKTTIVDNEEQGMRHALEHVKFLTITVGDIKDD